MSRDKSQLELENERLKIALEFYGNENNYFDDDIASDGTVYKFSSIEEDNGRLAREALTQCAKK